MSKYEISLERSYFTQISKMVLKSEEMSAELFSYDTGVEAIRLRNQRGEVVVLPYLGQMIWSSTMDQVPLQMGSHIQKPRMTSDLLATYGCLMYHSGILRNGNPGPGDTHALHGEMPCATMDKAGLAVGEDAKGPWLAVTGKCEYVRAFGDHYLASPSVKIRPASGMFEVTMRVQNLSAEPMDLMYMCHANFAFPPNAQVIQPNRFSSGETAIRQSIPAIVTSDEAYVRRIAEMAQDPSPAQWLNDATQYDPELVFYLKGLKAGSDGLTRSMLKRTQKDAFCVRHDPRSFGHAIRWMLSNSKVQVCGLSMPATCEVEGYTMEKKKGHVKTLPSGESTCFSVELGYLSEAEAQEEERLIQLL